MEPYVTADTLKEKVQYWLREIDPFNHHLRHLGGPSPAFAVFLSSISHTSHVTSHGTGPIDLTSEVS